MIDTDLIRVTVLAPTPAEAGMLERLLQPVSNIDIVAVETGPIATAATLQSQRPVDVLVLSCNLNSAAETHELAQLTAGFPGLEVVLFVPDQTASTLRAALRCGVREVMSDAEAPEELSAAFDRIRTRRRALRNYNGQLLAFMSCKGGSGATFIAANFGYTLASLTGKRVILIDLNLQFGDAILYLSDRRPASSVVDVAREIDRLDAALLKSAMTEILPNYSVLAAPSDPAISGDLDPAAVTNLLDFSLTQADYVIVDLGRVLDAPTIQALDRADFVFPVLQQTLPYIRDGKRMLDVFRSLGYSSDKVKPVLSRFDRSADVTVGDLEDALGVKVFASAANDFKVASASVNQGIAVSKLARNSALAKSLAEFAGKFESTPAPAQSSWLKRVLKRG